MAQIDVSQQALLALLDRVQREHGSTVVANFALDEQLNRTEAALAEMTRLRDAALEDAKALRENLKRAHDDNETLRCQLDPSRGDRFRTNKKAADGADEAQRS
jgi:hypothetical protein